jgi:hypothetical protein
MAGEPGASGLSPLLAGFGVWVTHMTALMPPCLQGLTELALVSSAPNPRERLPGPWLCACLTDPDGNLLAVQSQNPGCSRKALVGNHSFYQKSLGKVEAGPHLRILLGCCFHLGAV